MRLSIVIISDNSQDYLPKLFKSINMHTKINAEIIFIDNCSEDDSIECAKKNSVSSIYCFETKIKNRAILYNKGMELASMDYILFCHSDIYFLDDFFNQLYFQLSQHNLITMCNFAQYYVDGEYSGNNQIGIDGSSKSVFYKQHYQFTPHGMPIYAECSEACFLITKEIADQFSFDEKYLNSLFEYSIIDKIVKNKETIPTLEKCKFYHYCIEQHEKNRSLIYDLGVFKKYYPHVFELYTKDSTIMQLNEHIEELSKWGTSLDKEIEQKEIIITTQNEKIEELSKLRSAFEVELQNKKGHVELIIQSERNLKGHIELLLQSERNLKGHVEQLLDSDRELNYIKNTIRWRLVELPYKILRRLLPHNTKRRLLLRLVKNSLKHPRFYMGKLRLRNIKNLLLTLKRDGVCSINERINKFEYMNQTTAQIIVDTIDENQKQFDKLTVPIFEKPLVSIIIPVYNQFGYTYSCIKSIIMYTPDINYEIIVADDVSQDKTKEIKNIIENIQVCRNANNMGFLLNCNKAAKIAKGKYIFFLNNDTNVQLGWLSSLVDLMEADNSIGMAGSKLVYADGRLQEAGGIIWNDNSAWNYGRYDDPQKPEYNYVKEVDYISGAAIMIRKELWKQIGGFDERYVPAYCEDSDLAFEVRRAGYKVIYQPKSVVVHFEGISHGVDDNVGIKSYQIINQQKFSEKWVCELQRDHYQNAQNVFLARDRSKYKKTILVIDHYVPHFDKDAGSRTMFQYLELFSQMGLKVVFLGDNFYQHEPYTSYLQNMGIEVIYGSEIMKRYHDWLKDNGKYIDYTYLLRPHIAIKHIGLIKKYTQSKIMYNGTDMHYLRLMREYEISNDKNTLKEAQYFKTVEHELYSNSDILFTISTYEKKILEKEYPEKETILLPTFIYSGSFPKGADKAFDERHDLLFVGGFAHAPNVDGVIWFVNEILPKILKSLPNIKLNIIGSQPTKEILELQSDYINVLGFVEDNILESYYNQCRLVVAPLRFGAGVKGKIIESIAYGVPTVTTDIGAEGILNSEDLLLIENDPDKYAKKVISVYENDKLWTSFKNKMIGYSKDKLTNETAKNIFENIFLVVNDEE